MEVVGHLPWYYHVWKDYSEVNVGFQEVHPDQTVLETVTFTQIVSVVLISDIPISVVIGKNNLETNGLIISLDVKNKDWNDTEGREKVETR